jgi:hypothetical protein
MRRVSQVPALAMGTVACVVDSAGVVSRRRLVMVAVEGVADVVAGQQRSIAGVCLVVGDDQVMTDAVVRDVDGGVVLALDIHGAADPDANQDVGGLEAAAGAGRPAVMMLLTALDAAAQVRGILVDLEVMLVESMLSMLPCTVKLAPASSCGAFCGLSGHGCE